MDIEQEGLEAYEFAVGVVEDLRAAWIDLGRPTIAEGGATGRALVPHPLIREIRAQEKVVTVLRTAVKKQHRGPQPSGVIKPPRLSRDDASEVSQAG